MGRRLPSGLVTHACVRPRWSDECPVDVPIAVRPRRLFKHYGGSSVIKEQEGSQ